MTLLLATVLAEDPLPEVTVHMNRTGVMVDDELIHWDSSVALTKALMAQPGPYELVVTGEPDIEYKQLAKLMGSAGAAAGVQAIRLDHGNHSAPVYLVTDVDLPGEKLLLGKLPKDHIDAVMQGGMEGVRGCYQAGLGAEPELNGQVVITYRIDPGGTVSRSEVKSSTLDAPVVEACIADHISTLTFDDPQGTVIVHYPFVFQPG